MIDLLLSRYGTIDELKNYEIAVFLDLVLKAIEERRKAEIHQQWCAMLPYMSIGYLKYIPFNEYFDRCTGRNIDQRPASEILAEVHAISEKIQKGK